MKYTKESLKKINQRYCSNHYYYGITDRDLAMVNDYVELIERTRSETEPRIGDIIQYTNEYGDYYMSAHIDKVYEDGRVYICEQPYVPFIGKDENNDGICCSTSGGAWCNLPKDKLTYIGKREKCFCDWGSCGPCANGSIEFAAEVSVWEYTASGNKFISDINGKPYTTKEFNRMHVYYSPNKKDSNYNFFGDGHAWETDLEFQAWLRTFRAELFDWGNNHVVVWFWKEEKHHVSPKEYESIEGIEDTLMCNGTRKCKRVYDEENHTVHTYFVWYWDEDDGLSFTERATKQNKIRDELYMLDWKVKPNEYATREIISGKVEPISLNVLKRLGKNLEEE